MNTEIIKTMSIELNISEKQIENVLSLLQEGATVPFIARYRKEKTDGLMYKELSAFTTQRSKTVKDFQPNTLENCPQEKLIWRN